MFFLWLDGMFCIRLLSHLVYAAATAASAKSLQSCLTLCDPIDGSPPGTSIPRDSPAKNTGVGCHFLLQCVKVKSLSRVRLFATQGAVAYQAPPSIGFSRQEYWSGLPFPSPHLVYSIVQICFSLLVLCQDYLSILE